MCTAGQRVSLTITGPGPFLVFFQPQSQPGGPLKAAERPGGEDRGKKRKDGPGPVMVSDTLCPAVHILGT